MKNKKILILFLVLNLFLVNVSGLCATKNKPTKTLKASVEDYRIQYINMDWWNTYNDPILSGYISKAAQNNHDLKIASLRVKEGQEMVKKAFGMELPAVGLSPQYYVQKASESMKLGPMALPGYTQGSFLFPINVSYELDLWGQNRNRTAAAKKQLEAMKYDEKAAYISLTTAVAATYFNVLKVDKLLNIQKNIRDIRKQQFTLTKTKNDYGMCPMSDVLMAEKALNEAQISYDDLRKQQNIFLDQLAVLTGESSQNSSQLKRSSIDNLNLFKDMPTNLPSSVVLSRPDILKAEAELQKAKIDVTIARKDFLPKIDLFGQFGFDSNILKKAFNAGSYADCIGTNISENFFTGGIRRAILRARKYEYEAMLENYQKTILESFQEVDDSLLTLNIDTKKYNDNYNRVKLENKNASLISYSLDDGTISKMASLESKVKVLQTQRDKFISKTDYFIDTLSLYKASGGKNLVKEAVFIDAKK